MNTTKRLMYLLGTSFLIVDVAYFVWSVLAENIELIGLLTIGCSGLLCLLMAFYFGRVGLAAGSLPLAEDDPEADIDDGDSEIGFYSPWSWWPILLAGTASLALLGFAVGTWIFVIAIPLFVIALVGWHFEYYRGHFAR